MIHETRWTVRSAILLGLIALLIGNVFLTQAAPLSTDQAAKSEIKQQILTTHLNQKAYLKAPNLQANDRLGANVSIDGQFMISGALGDDSTIDLANPTGLPNSGAVHVYQRNSSGQWVHFQTLKAANAEANDEFGRSIDIFGNTIVVGARFEGSNGSDPADNSASQAGAAYVFTFDGTSWNQQAYLKASNAGAGDNFGVCVRVHQDTIAVSAFGEDSNGTNPADNSAPDSGAVYVFTRTNDVWSQEAYLKANNADAGDNFGWCTDIYGDTLIAGAPYEDGNGSDPSNNTLPNSGAGYIFTRTNGMWTQQAYLKASNLQSYDEFARSGVISGDTVVFGAQYEDGNGTDPANNSASDSGAVYVFTRTNDVWSQEAYLKADMPRTFAQLGWGINIDGDIIVAGAPYESDTTGTYSGAGYVFVRENGTWTSHARLKASNAGAGDRFGYGVDVRNGVIAIGADGESSGIADNPADNSAPNAGAAYVYAPNLAPLVDAGPDQIVPASSSVSLVGTATDPDGDALTFEWQQISGISVTLSTTATTTTTFTAPDVPVELVFQLTATDEHGASGSATVTVRIEQPKIWIPILQNTYRALERSK